MPTLFTRYLPRTMCIARPCLILYKSASSHGGYGPTPNFGYTQTREPWDRSFSRNRLRVSNSTVNAQLSNPRDSKTSNSEQPYVVSQYKQPYMASQYKQPYVASYYSDHTGQQ